MTDFDSMMKSRDITLLTNVHIVKAMTFPVIMYGCKNWTIKKAEHRKTVVFKLWCWNKFLRAPWIARRSNYSILKEITEKAMAPHSSTVARKIPWMEEPGRLQSMGSQRVRHDWATSLSLSTFMHWRRKWQPTPVFLPGESQGRGSLVGCSPWGRTESDTTKAT